ncbi:zinc-binding alcohol dehydrogenase family protein [Humibacter albus]|uniref:zinc-binding alcohol dehydrogenase family protein n=1 Tax=Humibacter albus TaxID=427754 RepID=UPI0003B7B230|nr:zinc-binding alcohol dehydrogenase family protein [Humibacter albus]
MESRAPTNRALWLFKPGRRFTVGAAPYTSPGPGEVVVRARAVAVNPVDNLPALGYRIALPWLTFPTVIGGDVAGDIAAVGPGVTRLRVGDRVLGMAAGTEKNRNRPAEGAFQHYVVLMQNLVSPIPDDMPYERAAVLPLTLSTAASGLFQEDQLGLELPHVPAAERDEVVVIWGGSTSVGSNGIQLARNAGYRVVTTASPRNFEYVRSLGASAVADYRSRTAVHETLDAIGRDSLAGVLAIGAGSLRPALAIASGARGRRRVATVNLGLAERLRARRASGVRLGLVWGGTLKDNGVGEAIYGDFLPRALISGSYRSAPEARVIGTGLEAIPEALSVLKNGVSARKLVVTL